MTVTSLRIRPGYEGANIRTWVGFRHFGYLAEAAVLEWFRGRGTGPARLFHHHGLGLEIVDSSLLLPAVLDVDDEVVATVDPVRPGCFTVRLAVRRDGAEVAVCRGRLTVALVREADGAAPVAAEHAGLVVADVREATTARPRDLLVPPGGDPAAVLAATDPGTFVHAWRVPYTACHFSDRAQHSAYLRALEEVVDRFLADRGISVRHMLAARGWIPVVSRVRVGLVADAHMEETVFTTFTVGDVLGGVSYDARMDCHVRRGDTLVHVATGRILHAYAVSRGPDAGRLARLDAATVAALTGGGSR